MEKGISSNHVEIWSKLKDPLYLEEAVSVLAEQLIPFFHFEWKEDEKVDS